MCGMPCVLREEHICCRCAESPPPQPPVGPEPVWQSTYYRMEGPDNLRLAVQHFTEALKITIESCGKSFRDVGVLYNKIAVRGSPCARVLSRSLASCDLRCPRVLLCARACVVGAFFRPFTVH